MFESLVNSKKRRRMKITKWLNGQYVLENDQPCSPIYAIFKNKQEALDFLEKIRRRNDANDS